MAKDTKNNEAPEAAGADDPLILAKQKRKKLIIIVGGVVLLIAVSIGGTIFGLKFFSGSDHAAEGHEEAAEEVEKKPAIYYALTPAFIVNFQDKGRTRFLQADLSLLIRDEDVSEALDKHMPLIRNNLVLLLSGQSFETLQSAEGKEALRAEALKAVQEVLQQEIGKPGVEQVLFTSFVMQ